MGTWQLQEAKARLSDLIKKAVKKGPQRITVRGQPAVIVISSEEYLRLKQPREGFVTFMRRSPLYGVDLDLRREQTPTSKNGIA